MIFKRTKYLDELYSALENEKLIIIYGARQVWKTTLLRVLLEDDTLDVTKKYINFDDIYDKKFKTKQDFINYLAFNYEIDFFNEGILFLDEIQTIDNIEQILKSLYDDIDIKIKIIATWSGLWQIKKLGSSLVWRVKQVWVYPFSFYEFLEYKGIKVDFYTDWKYKDFMFDKIEFLLQEYYLYGWYPAVVLEKTKEQKINKISEIIDMYLKKDIYFFLKEKELVSFKKLFSYLAHNISSGLNISKFSSYLGINRKRVEYYLEILEKSFLLYNVFPYYNDTRKEYSKQSEFFLNDTGIINYFRNNFNFLEFDWNIVENFTYLELLKHKTMFSDEIKTYNKLNWSEIDFIYCYKQWLVLPIEVKMKDNDVVPKIFSSFEKDYSDKIKYFIRTSTKWYSQSILESKKVQILPFWMVWKSIDTQFWE